MSGRESRREADSLPRRKAAFPYADILDREEPALHHPRMPMVNRAAQFSPFQSLEGYGEVAKEASRDAAAEAEMLYAERFEDDL